MNARVFFGLKAAIEQAHPSAISAWLSQGSNQLSNDEWSTLILLAITKLEKCRLFDANEKQVFELLVRAIATAANSEHAMEMNDHIYFVIDNLECPPLPLTLAAHEKCFAVLISEKYKFTELLSSIQVGKLFTFLSAMRLARSEKMSVLLRQYTLNIIKQKPINDPATWAEILSQRDVALNVLLQGLSLDAKKLVELSLSINVLDQEYKFPLFLMLLSAAPDLHDFHYHEFNNLIAEMLQQGADVHQKNSRRESALHIYLSRIGINRSPPSSTVCQLLIRAGANPNELDASKKPVFHLLFDEDQIKNVSWFECLKVMINEGKADVSLCNAADKNAVEVVREMNFQSNPMLDLNGIQEMNKDEVMRYLESEMNAKRLRTFCYSVKLFGKENNLSVPAEMINLIAGHVYGKPRNP